MAKSGVVKSPQQLVPIPAKVITLEEGWHHVWDLGIAPLHNHLNKNCLSADEHTTVPFSRAVVAEIYTVVYTMCTQRAPHNYAHDLYEKHGECVAEYVGKTVLPSLIPLCGFELLRELRKRWSSHKLYARWMERFFYYIDRFYVKLYAELPLYSKSVAIFRRNVFRMVSGPVREAILQAINNEREGKMIDEEIIRDVLQIYVDMSYQGVCVYETEFEEYFISATFEFYTKLSEGWLRTKPLPSYLRACEESIFAERDRVLRYLKHKTLRKVDVVVTKALLGNPVDRLLDNSSNVVSLLENSSDKDDLRRLYNLFDSVPNGLLPIQEAFKTHIITQGQKTMNSCSENVVDELSAQHEQWKETVRDIFLNTTGFVKAMRDAFEKVVNAEDHSVPFYCILSSWCDTTLRSHEKVHDPEQIEAISKKLSRGTDIFNFIEDKDSFLELYRQSLANRILNNCMVSEELEKTIIDKLRFKCGCQFTRHLEGMLQDTIKAAALQEAFEEYLISIGAQRNSTVLVLTADYWPSTEAPESIVLPSFQSFINQFETYYFSLDENKHRKLVWIHVLGTAEIEVTLKTGSFEFSCNIFQACLLLLFNTSVEASDSPVLKFDQIVSLLGLEEELIQRLLSTFMFLGIEFLKVVGTENETSYSNSMNWKDCQFAVNENFKSDKKIIVPALPQVSPTAKEKNKEDRSFAVDSAVVRVMKLHKTLDRMSLHNEVSFLLSNFKLSSKMISTSIDRMVDREFLELQNEESQVYRYVA